MAKNKIAQWAEMDNFPHVVQPDVDNMLGDSVDEKGKWSEFFGNDNPIVLELGCGKGEYTVGQARNNPNKNFIGIDIKGHRMWRGAKTSFDEGLKNVAFVRMRVDFLDSVFAKYEVAEIWLTFSDPQPKKVRKRLTSPIFTDRYKKVLSPGGLVHLKTDSDLLFEYTEEQIEEHGYDCVFSTEDLYEEGIYELPEEEQKVLRIETFYESMWLEMGKKIKYCKFKVN